MKSCQRGKSESSSATFGVSAKNLPVEMATGTAGSDGGFNRFPAKATTDSGNDRERL